MSEAPAILSDRPDLAVQIVNYNSAVDLLGCMNGLLHDLPLNKCRSRILVLDNASTSERDRDHLSALARLPGVQVYFSDNNIGFAAGHNLLLGKHEAPNVLILNPDILFHETNVTGRLMETLTERDDVKVVGPKLTHLDGDTQAYDHGELSPVTIPGLCISVRRRRKGPVAWVSGAAMLADGETLRKMGGFDERFFLYHEDEAYCLRVRREGGRVIYNPDVSLVHLGNASGGSRKYRRKSLLTFVENYNPGALGRIMLKVYGLFPESAYEL